MKNATQILLVRSTITGKELKYELESYKFDLTNEKLKQTILNSLSKKYNTQFDIVVETKQ